MDLNRKGVRREGTVADFTEKSGTDLEESDPVSDTDPDIVSDITSEIDSDNFDLGLHDRGRESGKEEIEIEVRLKSEIEVSGGKRWTFELDPEREYDARGDW